MNIFTFNIIHRTLFRLKIKNKSCLHKRKVETLPLCIPEIYPTKSLLPLTPYTPKWGSMDGKICFLFKITRHMWS